jgi:poly-beta-1,6-N-acetyl-D-glucosamine synthase
MPGLQDYVLLTAARNEVRFIEETIKSVISQTIRPVRWVIVSDGSTDGTDDLVNKYAAEIPWIRLVRMPERRERHFSGKVQAINAGYDQVRDLKYDVICSLDADITFDKDYFAFLLSKLSDDPVLGLVGTPFKEGSRQTYDYRFVNIEHVSGACQVFRRECFEQIGGYVPVRGGGIDYIAVTTARMKGWKTRTFTDKVCWHHREIGTAQHSALAARFKYGFKDYTLGNHPLWQVFRTAYQMTNQPYLLGGCALCLGYIWAYIRRAERPISPELLAFVRREQMRRLGRFMWRKPTAPFGSSS